MGFGLAGLGYAAGGLATGLSAGMKIAAEQEDIKDKRDERARKEGLRLAAQNTYGNVGQQREDGSVYSDQDASNDYLRQSAPYDNNPIQSRAAAQGLKKGAMEVRSLERQDATQQRIDEINKRFLDAWRNPGNSLATMYNSDDGVFGAGGHAGTKVYVQPTEKGYMAQFSGPDMQIRHEQEFTHDQVSKMLQQKQLAELAAVAPDKYLQTAINLGVKMEEINMERQKIKDTREHYERSDRTNEQYRLNQGPVLEAQADEHRARAGLARRTDPNRSMYFTPQYDQVGELADGTPVNRSRNEAGGYYNGLTGQPLSQADLKGLKMSPKATGVRAAEDPSDAGFIRDFFLHNPGAKPTDAQAALSAYQQARVGAGQRATMDDFFRPGAPDPFARNPANGLPAPRR